jgi:hypothetical protein
MLSISSLIEYPVQYLRDDGGKYFLGLLNASDFAVGWELPTVTFEGHDIKLIDVIGEGASSIVYEGELSKSKEKVCVKYFRKENDPHMERELTNLEIIKPLANQGMVTNLIGQHFACTCEQIGEATRRHFLNASPKSAYDKRTFNISTASDFCSLIDIITKVHKLGLIHRDIKHGNFFKYNNQVCELPSFFFLFLFFYFHIYNTTHQFMLAGIFE